MWKTRWFLLAALSWLCVTECGRAGKSNRADATAGTSGGSDAGKSNTADATAETSGGSDAEDGASVVDVAAPSVGGAGGLGTAGTGAGGVSPGTGGTPIPGLGGNRAEDAGAGRDLASGGAGGSDSGSDGRADGALGAIDGGIDAAGGSPGDCGGRCQALEQCWKDQLCVATSVPVPAGFAIDATEVTRGQYTAWLATNPSTAQQSDLCAWNTTFTPEASCMLDPSVCQGTGCTRHPQPCVDACDAAAYCKTVGKRLCGALGGGSVSTMNDATQSQWYNACSSNGAQSFTYGQSVVPGNCNDYTMINGKTTVPVASMLTCQSSLAGYQGIFDLIGNLWEWEDNCSGSAGANDTCRTRGNSFGSGAASQSCTQMANVKRATSSPILGFRCCVP